MEGKNLDIANVLLRVNSKEEEDDSEVMDKVEEMMQQQTEDILQQVNHRIQEYVTDRVEVIVRVSDNS
jgi:hypothetical protein